MYLRIKNIIEDQILLIKPIVKNGTTSNIRKEAIGEIINLRTILDELKNTAIERSPVLFPEEWKYPYQFNESIVKNFINKNKGILISCFITMYKKLKNDSRTLPTNKLKNIADKDADNIMKIWSQIEKNN